MASNARELDPSLATFRDPVEAAAPVFNPRAPDFLLSPHRSLKGDGPYDSRFLPATIAVCLVSALAVVFSGAVVRLHAET
jgi:hypothetical protein